MAKVLDLEVDAEDVFKLLDPRDQNLMLDYLLKLGSRRLGKPEEPEPEPKVRAMTVAKSTEEGRLNGH